MKNAKRKILTTAILLIVQSFAAKSQTNVSGGIFSNTTWTLANSPYIVVDTVVVFPGVTLTIQPGVTVKFANNQQLEIRQAQLIANGTVTDSITFTSNSSSPTPGIYAGVKLNGGSMASQFSYCNLNFSYNGIQNGSAGYGFIIKHCKIAFNVTGISGGGLGNNSVLDSCIIESNTGTGVGEFDTIQNCTISKNHIGVYDGFTIINCVIDSNTQIGVSENTGSTLNCFIRYNGTGIQSGNPLIINNCVITHNQTGIDPTANQTITNCVIDSNSIGIDNGSTLFAYHNYIANCEIKYDSIGIIDYGSSLGLGTNTFTRNSINNNTIGILLAITVDSFYCNSICSNSSFDLKYTLSANTNCVAGNYWCTTDSASTEAVIYDAYDNINLGIVNYMPIDTSQCYLTGCLLEITASVVNATCDTCQNGSATINITHGFAPYTYTWFTSPIQTTQAAIGLAPGTYTVCVIDGHGCSVCDSSIFLDSTNCSGFSIASHSTNSTCSACNDGTVWVNVTGGTPPYFYTWYTSPFQNTDTAINLMQGTYAVCITDANGCLVCDSAIVSAGNCSAYFNLYPDILPHHYNAVNMASGTPPLTYLWSWGDSTYDTIPYPNHTYAAAGFYSICLTITDSAGCSNMYCNSYYLLRPNSTNTIIHVNVISSINVGIQENREVELLSIFPNPATANLTLKFTKPISKAEIKILNPLGEIEISNIETKQQATVDVSKLASGIYILEAISGNKIYRQKFIKE